MQRADYLEKITNAFSVHPVVALLGPRQCGKTTLAQSLFEDGEHPRENYFDLENPIDEQRLHNPLTALKDLEGLIVIDEVQRAPELFKVLRVLVDRKESQQRFFILGSASRHLIRQSSESLAGRIQYIELTPFQLGETGAEHMRKLWLRGGLPRSFLAKDATKSRIWRDAYIRTYLEQDIPNLGIQISPSNLRRFWMMLVHYHGHVFNASEIGKSLQLSDVTVRTYLDILVGTFVIRQLQPWQENLKKRQIKRPRIYFRDSGLLHRLLLLHHDKAIEQHPKLGASWEGFALEEVIRALDVAQEEVYFWGVHAQAELDLFTHIKGKRVGFEIKYCDAPKLSKSMTASVSSLKLDELRVIYPGDRTYKLENKIKVLPLATFALKGKVE